MRRARIRNSIVATSIGIASTAKATIDGIRLAPSWGTVYAGGGVVTLYVVVGAERTHLPSIISFRVLGVGVTV